MRRVAHRVSLDVLLDVLNGRRRFVLPEGARFVAIDIDHIQQDARLASESETYDLVDPGMLLPEEPLAISGVVDRGPTIAGLFEALPKQGTNECFWQRLFRAGLVEVASKNTLAVPPLPPDRGR